MKMRARILGREIRRAAAAFPAVLVTGPRRAGKTTLLRRLFPRAQYVLLETADIIAQANADPQGFLDRVRCPVILDEIQNAPGLFGYIRARIDAAPRQNGRWLLTGSQEAPLMRGTGESMAGRAAVFQLLPFTGDEDPRVSPFAGGFPEALARPRTADIWFSSYVQTYLERDIRAISDIRDLSVFRRCIALLASRCGQMLNKTEVAAALGISVPTVTHWLGMLETTGQIILVQPFFENFGKRLVKTPKLYFVDSGLLCHLLGIRTAAEMQRSPFAGAIFESFVAAEIFKHRRHRGLPGNLYYFRDYQGLEVDFLIDDGGRRLTMVEVKMTGTPMPHDAGRLRQLAAAIRTYEVRSYLVCTKKTRGADGGTVAPDVPAISWRELHAVL